MPPRILTDEHIAPEIYETLRQYLESNPDAALLMNQIIKLSKATPDPV